jgi:hypothetical protein
MRRLFAFAGAVGIAVLIVATVASAIPDDKPGKGEGQGGPPNIEISGSVGPVYPLVDTLLGITVENPANFMVEVTKVTVTVGDASAACTADNLSVEAVEAPFTVPPRGEATITTPVRLVGSVVDACQGATFPLVYHATAVKG